MNQTENISELVIALAKAQGSMEPAKFNRINPHFKNRYADFTSIMDACRKPLSENGLSVMQYCETISEKLCLVTMLAHISGQWMKSFFPLNPKNLDSQSIGSAMTYAKRYSLSAMLGIVSDEEDDDGEASIGRGNSKPMPKQTKISDQQANILADLSSQLDDSTVQKVQNWLKSSQKIETFTDILSENFAKVKSVLENAVKMVEQDKAVKHA